MAHMCLNSDSTTCVANLLKDISNLIFDTADINKLSYDVFVKSANIFPNQIVFDSDTPSLSPEVELIKIEVSEELYSLNKEQKRKILGGNATRILELI